MKHLIYILFLATACSGSKTDKPEDERTANEKPAAVARPDDAMVIADQSGPDSLKGSLRAKAEGKIGKAQISVRYYSPAVRGRIIWGGLVPFDKVWVTGAHMATSVEFDQDLIISGQKVAAGKYAFFTFPGKEAWELVVNRNWEQHLADNYDPKLDVVRVKVKPVTREVLQERLQYSVVGDDGGTGKLVVRWEKLEVSLPIMISQ